MPYFLLKLSLIFFVSISSFCSTIRFDIGMIYKKGVDKGLVLVNELHEIKFIHKNRESRLTMRNGISLSLKASFLEEITSVGPSGMIKLSYKLLDEKGDPVDGLEEQFQVIPLWEKQIFRHDFGEGKLIEVHLTPRFF